MRNSHSLVAMQGGGAGVGAANMDSGNLVESARTVTWAKVRILSVIYVVILVSSEKCFLSGVCRMALSDAEVEKQVCSRLVSLSKETESRVGACMH